MDINNNTNISNMVASSISKLTLNTASRAFEASKKTIKAPQTEEENNFEEEALIPQEDTKPMKSNVDVDEIRQYAGLIGESLTEEEINYGLRYGRSVIADFSA